jgi:hypothetical protein
MCIQFRMLNQISTSNVTAFNCHTFSLVDAWGEKSKQQIPNLINGSGIQTRLRAGQGGIQIKAGERDFFPFANRHDRLWGPPTPAPFRWL